jgi:ElaB/YqjD/DUF883 family membrane-anchored ribosome-binding protein
MKSDRPSSVPVSEDTSRTVTQRQAPRRLRTERELLEQQAYLARAGMAQALGSAQADARELFDFESFAREKPWWTVGLGAGAGFLTGRSIFSTESDSDEHGRRKRGPGLAAVIAPLLVPVVGIVLKPLFGGGSDDDLAPSPLQRIAYGPILTGLIKRLI